MQLISVLTITFIRTRPHPQLTSRLPPVGYAKGFLIALVKKKYSGYWWGWAGLN
jgi:hypothetical protein